MRTIVTLTWMGEAEMECRAREIPVPTMDRFRDRVQSDALGIFVWIAVAMAAPWVMHLALE